MRHTVAATKHAAAEATAALHVDDLLRRTHVRRFSKGSDEGDAAKDLLDVESGETLELLDVESDETLKAPATVPTTSPTTPPERQRERQRGPDLHEEGAAVLQSAYDRCSVVLRDFTNVYLTSMNTCWS